MPKHKLRVIPLGGLGEIGKNMMALEYGNDIVAIDAGLMFPEEDMLGELVRIRIEWTGPWSMRGSLLEKDTASSSLNSLYQITKDPLNPRQDLQ